MKYVYLKIEKFNDGSILYRFLTINEDIVAHIVVHPSGKGCFMRFAQIAKIQASEECQYTNEPLKDFIIRCQEKIVSLGFILLSDERRLLL